MRILTIMVVGILLVSGTCNEEIENKEQLAEELKNVVKEIRKGCEANDYEYAAKWIVYRGDDATRKWKDLVNYANPPEHSLVASVCSKIDKAYGPAKSFEVVGYEEDTESEGTWHTIEALFLHDGKKKECSFSFLKIKDQYALGDIDFD